MKVAVVPARGGSKRIPRKNIKPFCGKPIIAYSIEAARAAGCFDHIICSTDDDEIADIAEHCGAEVPFRRPAQLADDHATTLDVMGHYLDWAAAAGQTVDHLCCVYPTAPFVRPDDLTCGFKLMVSQTADFCLPVAAFAAPIQRAVRRRDDGRLEMLQPQNYPVRSQDLEETYHDAGQFIWGTAQAFGCGKPIFEMKTVPVILPRWRVVDIDTPEDWSYAEILWDMLRSHPRR